MNTQGHRTTIQNFVIFIIDSYQCSNSLIRTDIQMGISRQTRQYLELEQDISHIDIQIKNKIKL